MSQGMTRGLAAKLAVAVCLGIGGVASGEADIRVGESSVIRGNTAFQNGIGIGITCFSAVLGNTARNNGLNMELLEQSGTFADNNTILP